MPPIAFEDAALLERLPRFPGADQSIEAISAAALGQGLVNPIEDVDAIIRRVPLVANVNGRPAPGFNRYRASGRGKPSARMRPSPAAQQETGGRAA